MKMIHEEIGTLLESWKDNEYATASQLIVYKNDKKLIRPMLGNKKLDDGRDCIRLLEQDGFDGDYVGSVAPSTAIHYFYDNCDHKWPYDRDTVRIGLFFHLGLYKTLCLILKSKWEQFLSLRIKEACDDARGLINSIKGYSDTTYVGDFAVEFKKESDRLFDIFEYHNSYVSNCGYNAEMFKNLLFSMATAKLQFFDIDSDIMDSFVECHKKEMNILSSIDEEIKSKYIKIKTKWMTKIGVIEKLLQKQETIAKDNTRIKAKWANEFGERWLKLCELENEYNMLAYYLDIKGLEPGLSFEAVKKIAKEKIEKRKKELEHEQMLMEHYNLMHIMSKHKMEYGGEVSYENMHEVFEKDEKKRTKIKRKIYMLTHPDKFRNEQFTNSQLTELEELYKSTIELCDIDGTMLFMLENIYARAKEIWDSMGIDTAISEVFPTFNNKKDIIDVAEKRLLDIEQKESNIRNDIFIMLEDEDIISKKRDLASASDIQDRLTAINKEIDKLETAIKEKAEELEEQFEEGEFNWS